MNLRIKNKAILFIILLGFISLFSDMTYESARSINGPFLSILGASAVLAGFTAGLGEFIGYAMRLVSGYLVDKTKSYWLFTSFGYSINLFAVPLLAFANRLDLAIILMILERLGKAIRNPSRDALLSFASSQTGRGFGFGLHEALDQIGAIIGPIIVMLILFFHHENYKLAYLSLLIPATIAISILFFVMMNFKTPQNFEIKRYNTSKNPKNLHKMFWIYSVFVSLSMLGYAHFIIISYHIQENKIVHSYVIPLIFSFAMASDGISALVFGKMYDKKGLKILIAIPILSIIATPLVFSCSSWLIIVGMVIWGIILGIQETVLKASVGDMVNSNVRGFAYGIFNSILGFSWFLGSLIMGILYELSISYVIIFSILVELIAIPFVWYIAKYHVEGKQNDI